MNNDFPIGVFDSGVGGLTVASELKAELPLEQIYYFGDTARCPYGDRTTAEVLEYSIEICNYLVRQGVKMLVVACNTATAAALPELQVRYPVPVLGVVQPGARAAVRSTLRGKVGVIGTVVTVQSGVYEDAVKRLNPDAQVISLACPEFVPLVERGETTGNHVYQVVARRLQPLQEQAVDTLILGCTHYPHLQAVIQQVMGPQVHLISSAHETTREVARVLSELRLATNRTMPVADKFFTTGPRDRMANALHDWMGVVDENADVVEVHLSQTLHV